ncbi:MAG TPA: aldehyde dehydrogenase family protein, partial [Rhodoglobus sp.]|nr:aldehyde dehydrogenase family protein [Rhodoglobus sp.]
MTEIVKPHRFLDYAPAPESTSILHLKKSYGLFIDGEFVKGHGKPFLTVAPATEEKIAEIANANSKDVDAAVAAARRAYDRTWSK